MVSRYKFQKLDVYRLALLYVEEVYSVANRFPSTERFNLTSQFIRAATSIPLNIAEGSTGQSDTEQSRYLTIAIRSYLETIACIDLVEQRDYLDHETLDQFRQCGHNLFVKLVAFRNRLSER